MDTKLSNRAKAREAARAAMARRSQSATAPTQFSVDIVVASGDVVSLGSFSSTDEALKAAQADGRAMFYHIDEVTTAATAASADLEMAYDVVGDYFQIHPEQRAAGVAGVETALISVYQDKASRFDTEDIATIAAALDIDLTSQDVLMPVASADSDEDDSEEEKDDEKDTKSSAKEDEEEDEEEESDKKEASYDFDADDEEDDKDKEDDKKEGARMSVPSAAEALQRARERVAELRRQAESDEELRNAPDKTDLGPMRAEPGSDEAVTNGGMDHQQPETGQYDETTYENQGGAPAENADDINRTPALEGDPNAITERTPDKASAIQAIRLADLYVGAGLGESSERYNLMAAFEGRTAAVVDAEIVLLEKVAKIFSTTAETRPVVPKRVASAIAPISAPRSTTSSSTPDNSVEFFGLDL